MSFRAPIQAELKRFDEDFPKAFSTKVPLMDLVLRYAVKQKGKRLRPALVFLTAKSFSSSPLTDRAQRGAVLVELMHTATLIHDDVVDDANTRRGAFSISALWKNKIAVLVGHGPRGATDRCEHRHGLRRHLLQPGFQRGAAGALRRARLRGRDRSLDPPDQGRSR